MESSSTRNSVSGRTTRTLKIIAATIAVCALSPDTRGASIEERLAALEKLVADQAAEIAGLKKELGYTKKADAPNDAPAAVAYTPPVLVRPAGKATRVTLGGFVQALGEVGGTPDPRYNGTNDRFYVRRARLLVNASFAEHFAASLGAEFGAASVAGGSGTRGQMVDGFVEWRKFPDATIRLGQFKTPFGYEQIYSDTRVFTIERGLASDRLTFGRQIGAMVTGDVLDKRLSYSLAAFNGNGTNNGNNDDEKFMFVGRLNGILAEIDVNGRRLRWQGGVNAMQSDDNAAFVGRRSGFGLDTQVLWGPGTFQAEWLRNSRDPVTGTRVDSEGWSLLGAWAIDKHWRGVVRFDRFDSDTALRNTETDLWVFGLDYLFKGDDLRLSLNYMLGEQPEPIGRDDRLVGRLQVIF
ncbi:hypothetical protein ASA1KI_28080 [Opitutales bacterium ASA1]|uniref:porin n=1 Tax=Congregicoccus parvus TaxID=3081749 RepID=UPI002B2912AC|nr:hypothetical protein ASA1KI_28080 [Opitutales bacterium ASA1]